MRRHVVKDLSDEEFEFVIQRILEGDTDRELSAAFQAEFDKRLAKSSLHRWRKATGAELAERYRLARFQARQLLSDLEEGDDADKYQVVMRSIEDRLLTATREVTIKDPLKLLRLNQQEQFRKLREKQLALKEKQLEFAKEKARRESEVNVDRFRIAAEVWRFVLLWFARNDAAVADRLTHKSEELLKDLEAQLETQTA
ncbi:MAG: hypothetical protein ACRD9R_10825 [Pyrinomonadaceae bacterium]